MTQFSDIDFLFKDLNRQIADKEGEIAAKETEISRLNDQLEELMSARKSVDDVRVLIMQTRSANIRRALGEGDEAPVGLQEAVLSVFSSLQGASASVVTVTRVLKSKDFPNSSARHFYTNVSTTIKRLAAKGKLELVEKRGTAVFYQLPHDSENTQQTD